MGKGAQDVGANRIQPKALGDEIVKIN